LRAGLVVHFGPMPRHFGGLPVHFKNQLRMPRRANFRIHGLMTRHAGVRADVKTVHIAHPGCHPVRVRVIQPRMRTNPIFRGSMTALARNAFRHGNIVPQPLRRNGGKRRMTNRATRTLRWICDFKNLRQPLGARGFQRGVRPCVMKIMRRPDRILFALFTRATVATACAATSRAEKFRFENS